MRKAPPLVLAVCMVLLFPVNSPVLGADATPRTGNVAAPAAKPQGVGKAVEGMKKPVATPQLAPAGGAKTRNIKCPAEVQVEVHNIHDPGYLAPWSKSAHIVRIDKAQITFQEIYNKDSLQCVGIGRHWLSQLVEKGSCTVGRDNLSFDCKVPDAKVK